MISLEANKFAESISFKSSVKIQLEINHEINTQSSSRMDLLEFCPNLLKRTLRNSESYV